MHYEKFELPNGLVPTDVILFKGMIFAATEDGILVWRENAWHRMVLVDMPAPEQEPSQ